ncbi:SRPBCC domain-containing protein [Rathayibacter sp. YIM 133350]|uniref:SRPBCC family protein n=1 Tax=Rathayibacter sp. YIM 133350 TaxID=3131992 RepID=UPI00307DB170
MNTFRVSKDVDRREITLERELPADPDRVWRSWTVAEELEAWWGPAGWVTTVRSLDVRPGGLWHFGMGPTGEEPETWIRSVYSEVIDHAALAYVEGFSDATGADLDPESQVVTVEFFGLDPGRTRLVLCTRFSSLARLERIAGMGMVEGWEGGFDRLDTHLTEGSRS